MLKSLGLKNFTVFPDTTFECGQQLTVIVGENGLGKTHILKAAYCGLAVSASGSRDTGVNPTKTYLQTALANKLRSVFRPDTLGRLARQQAGRSRSEVRYQFAEPQFDLRFSFNTASKSEVVIDQLPADWISGVPIYLLTRELLTIYPGFVSLYETTDLAFEETWRDTAILLGAPLARGPRTPKIRDLLQPLEAAMDGNVELDAAGRLYLHMNMGRIEMHLVAEGLRKLAMIARLIATGALLDKGYLFWDEPESNLNPKLIKLVARMLLTISQSSIQVFIASHNLFLLRELHIFQQQDFPTIDARYAGLHLDRAGGVVMTQGKTIDDIGDIAALDEQLMQSERYMAVEDNMTVTQPSR